MQAIEIKRQVPVAESASDQGELRRISGVALAGSDLGDMRPRVDAVDELMHSLSARNPRFATMIAEARRSFAPLATASDGGVTLTSLRMSARLTQTELAERIGQKQSNVSLMESGKRDNINRDTMKRMCDALGCDMNTLDASISNSVAMNEQYLKECEIAHAARCVANERKSA